MFKVILLLFFANTQINALILKQVLFLGRHNIRAPLSKSLEELTEKKWPTWKTEAAYLTKKGKLLEGYMGEYFSKWIEDENLFEGPCPDSVHIYANAPHRTVVTAEAFANSAFKFCDIKVNFKENVVMDPVFHPVLRNTSEEFKNMVTSEMRKRLDELDLNESYKLVNNILDFGSSKLCKTTSFCDMTNKTEEILYEIGEEPHVYGPLSLGNTVADVCLMSLYEGYRMEDIAWGKIRTPADWKILTEITRQDQNVRFNGTFSKHLTKPLLDYMTDLFLNESAPKFIGLFGHDSNLKALMSALGFKPYELPRQYELTPIGGKLVFQKWYDPVSAKYFLKIEYIYPSVGQLRFSTKFWEEEQPQKYVMELDKCLVGEKGFCPWDHFVDILKNMYP